MNYLPSLLIKIKGGNEQVIFPDTKYQYSVVRPCPLGHEGILWFLKIGASGDFF